MQFIDLKTQYRMLEDEIKSSVHIVLEHGKYILGPEVAELEKMLLILKDEGEDAAFRYVRRRLKEEKW